MSSVREVSFELERFGVTGPDRLEVVGRWTGLSGRRLARAVLTFDAGGQRHRLPALPGGQLAGPEESWRATFAWDGAPEDISGAELEVGRSLVVDLPAPRRRSSRHRDEPDVHAQVTELRAIVAELRAERAHAEAARDSEEEDELAALRLAHGSLRAAYEQLEDEVEPLRESQAERDRLEGELAQARERAGEHDEARAELLAEVRELRVRAEEGDAAREQLAAELEEARQEIAALKAEVDAGAEALSEARRDAEQRVEAERATTTEVHGRLATAREELQRAITAEAQETERLRSELETAREDAERLLATERAESARLREELALRADEAESDGEETTQASRRMLERVTRDLDRERAATRHLRRELETLRSQTAEHRRAQSSSGNGTLATDEGTATTFAGARTAAARTPLGTRRRIDAARVAAERRVPRVPPSTAALWAVRIAAALVVALLGVMLVILVSAVA